MPLSLSAHQETFIEETTSPEHSTSQQSLYPTITASKSTSKFAALVTKGAKYLLPRSSIELSPETTKSPTTETSLGSPLLTEQQSSLPSQETP